MSDNRMKWWLISGEDVKVIQEALQTSTHRRNDYNCPDEVYGWETPCVGCEGDKLRERASYLLETGLHITEAIPDDFRAGKEDSPAGRRKKVDACYSTAAGGLLRV